MRKHLAGAAATLALTLSCALATAASATTFVGSYSTSYNSADPGLVLQTADLTPNLPVDPTTRGFTFDLSTLNQTTHVDLFNVWTNEASVDGDDLLAKPISVSFSFTQPTSFGGSVDGISGGTYVFANIFKGFYQNGYIVWEDNGNTVLNFGNTGQLAVHLDNASFNTGSPSWFNSHLNPTERGAATITANFKLVSLDSAPVPEPATWAMMLMGFLGLGAAIRANRREDLKLSALEAAI